MTRSVEPVRMQDFRTVRAWQANRELVVLIYRTTSRFPKDERFGLTAQTRSAVVSIGANIAEGCGRGSRADMLRFLQMGFASGTETLHHLITALDLGYLRESEFTDLENRLESVRRMLGAFIRRVRQAQRDE